MFLLYWFIFIFDIVCVWTAQHEKPKGREYNPVHKKYKMISHNIDLRIMSFAKSEAVDFYHKKTPDKDIKAADVVPDYGEVTIV